MVTDDSFESAWDAAKSLAKQFSANLPLYMSNDFQEVEVRKYFLDKFFKSALAWDVDHEKQLDPYRREVRIEKPEKKSKGRADYAFSIAPHYRRVRFFVEAKRPQANIASPDNCFQAIRYSWPKGIPVVVLTDFNSIHVIDSRFRPNINSASKRIIRTWHSSDLLDREKFAEIYYLLSRDAVASGSLEHFAEQELPAIQVAAKQYTLFADEARDFDDDFLIKMDEWRETLAVLFKRARNDLDGEQLTECVQRTIDRLIFTRFLEDKHIEQEPVISKFGQHNKTHWQDFVTVSKRLDRVYNGIVFKPHSVIDNPSFNPESAVFADICDELTDEHSPYNFDSIPVEILGRIYERFLGKVVQATSKRAKVVEKDNVRKAGGVYYTPDYIVSYMVDQSLGKQVRGKKPEDVLKIRLIDTACGSGSFLIGAFSYLLQELTTYWRKQKKPPKGVVETRDGESYLTLQYKRQILLSCIFGVDIDAQAAEVAQLSLYLKLMEEETTDSIHQQQMELDVALLPSLGKNIIVGNSLVTLEDNSGDLFALEKLSASKSLDFKAAFPSIFRSGGFDLVIGNPPYIKEFTNRDAFEHLYASPYYQGKMDIWYLFACRGLDWLKPETGVLAFIATNNWVTNAGAKIMRDKVTTDARIEQLIDFGNYKVFRDAGIQTMILIMKRSQSPDAYQFDYRRLDGNKPNLANAQSLLEKRIATGCVYLTPEFVRNRASGKLFTFSSSNIEQLLDKITECRNFSLDSSKEVAQGIVAPQDFLNAKGNQSLGNKYQIGQGIFNLTQEEVDNLCLSNSELGLLKPIYTTAELGRYLGNSKNRYWTIYTDSKFKNPSSIMPYPSIKKHLDQFRKIITSDNAPYGLHRARDEKFFIGEKIVSARKCASPIFTYTDFPCYVSQTFNVIKTDRVNQLYLTGLLNSRLTRFWLKNRGKMQGQNFQVDKEPLLSVPICVPDIAEQERIGKIVQRQIECLKKIGLSETESARSQFQRIYDQSEDQLQDAIELIYGLSEGDRDLLK